MIERLAIRLARRWFLRRVDGVLHAAYRARAIDSWLLHELDHRLKYEPERPWPKREPLVDAARARVPAGFITYPTDEAVRGVGEGP